MSEKCAHLCVEYRNSEHGGLVYGQWICSICNMPFVPKVWHDEAKCEYSECSDALDAKDAEIAALKERVGDLTDRQEYRRSLGLPDLGLDEKGAEEHEQEFPVPGCNCSNCRGL